MGRIDKGAAISVRNLPSPAYEPYTEKEPPPFYLEWTNTLQMRALRQIARYYADITRTVEEYSGESVELGTGENVLTVTPDYEPASEIITSIFVTGPPLAPFTLQLGGRYMTLVTDASGKLLLAPVFIRLKASDQRKLTAGTIPASPGIQDGANGAIVAATAGNVALPNATDSLEGFSISLSTVGTAAMTVTVSNVVGGPYVYTILTGGSSLSVNYPIPLRSTGAAPTVSWSATAAAVGNVAVFGLTAPIPAAALGSWFLQMSGYALARNEAG